MEKVRIGIGIPTAGTIESTCYDNHLELFGHLGKLEALSQQGIHNDQFVYPEGVEFEFKLCVIPRLFPALAREKIAEYVVEWDCDYLFMYDDDMILPSNVLERLFSHRVDIVAPLAFTRLAPYRPVMYNLTKGYDKVEKKDYYINLEVPNYPRDELVQVDAVGFGAVLIDTKVLKALPKSWFMTTSGAGEDIHFCHKAGEAGFKIFMDTATKLGHMGERTIVTEALYDLQEEAKPRKVFGSERKYKK